MTPVPDGARASLPRPVPTAFVSFDGAVSATGQCRRPDLTCGGYGLTGVIVSATLHLEPLPGHIVSIRRFAEGSPGPGEALRLVRELAGKSLFAYSWHDGAPATRTFGRGFVHQGCLVPGTPSRAAVGLAYRVLTPEARALLPFSLWGGVATRAFTSTYWHAERRQPEATETSLFDAMFPFARRAPTSVSSGDPARPSARSSSPTIGRRPSSPSCGTRSRF